MKGGDSQYTFLWSWRLWFPCLFWENRQLSLYYIFIYHSLCLHCEWENSKNEPVMSERSAETADFFIPIWTAREVKNVLREEEEAAAPTGLSPVHLFAFLLTQHKGDLCWRRSFFRFLQALYIERTACTDMSTCSILRLKAICLAG